MLTREAAEKLLKEWEAEGKEERFLPAVGRLPAELRKIGYGMLGRKEDGTAPEERMVGYYGPGHGERTRALKQLDGLPPRDRINLISLLLPACADQVERGWQLLKGAPYREEYRSIFVRVPRDPELTVEGRANWLSALLMLAVNFREDVLTVPWLAAWAPHLHYGSSADEIGTLCAAAIDAGGPLGDEVFDILRQSARGEHEIGSMGSQVTTGLFQSSREEGWEFIEKMLLAAQRQEGLRQSILSSLTSAHPEAFRRMLRLIREHDLARFSAVVKAANDWLGLQWDSVSVKVVNETLAAVEKYLADESARKKALTGGDAEQVHLALWSEAFYDAESAIPLAEKLLAHKKPDVRFAAAQALVQIGLPTAARALLPALDDEDLRVALWAAPHVAYPVDEDENAAEDGADAARPAAASEGELFGKLEGLFRRLPDKPTKLKPLVWPWTEQQAKREMVAGMLVRAIGKLPPTRLLPYLDEFGMYDRARVVAYLSRQKKWDSLTRDTLLALVGDASQAVRQAALEALAKGPLQRGDAERLEALLTRKADDLRRGVVDLLLKGADDAALASADRLLASRDGNQRLAGLELLRQLIGAKKSLAAARQRGEAFQAPRGKLTKEEQNQLAAILSEPKESVTLENGLGLFDPAQRTPLSPPRKLGTQLVTKAAVACLQSLDDLIHEHRETPIRIEHYRNEQEWLLGEITYEFPEFDTKKPYNEQRDKLPLAEVWEAWFRDRPASLRDADGLELVRASMWLDVAFDWSWEDWNEWVKKSAERKSLADVVSAGNKPKELRYGDVLKSVLLWLLWKERPAKVADFLLDAAETLLAQVPESDHQRLTKREKEEEGNYAYDDENDWREQRGISEWVTNVEGSKVLFVAESWTVDQIARRWSLLHWMDEPVRGARRHRPDWHVLRAAYLRGTATLADIAEALVGPPDEQGYGAGFGMLDRLTQPKLADDEDAAFLKAHPEVAELLDRCRARILEIELARGEGPTPATKLAQSVNSLWGTTTLLRVLSSLGKARFKTVSYWRAAAAVGREAILTQLAKVTYPVAGDTAEDFVQRVKQAIAAGEFPEERIGELAFLAPQWARFIEAWCGWDGFCEGLYWFLAHMRYVSGADQATFGTEYETTPAADAQASADNAAGDQGPVPRQKKVSAWERLILERTSLSDEERSSGAIDVGWFRRVHERLGEKRWQVMSAAARFAANAAQANKAQFLADVLAGKASRKELLSGVRKKKLKDHVRLLGLLPLASGTKRDADLAERYQALQEYKRYAKGLSAMSKPDALRAVEIGMANLARTAGYADPLRLEWAQEAESVRDLVKGPVSIAKDGVTVTLALDEQSQPQLTVRRGAKELASIPPAVKKDKKVKALTERVPELKRQASRMKQSLEAAMCRGDVFTGSELAQLCEHAVLAPLLSRLVLVGDGILGYPDKKGKALRDFGSRLEPVKKNEQLRIAHPHDLFAGGNWEKWQHECFQAERLQPFKQVFRELYLVTKQEKADGTSSSRYAGQQIQPRQAFALFGQRGWNTQDEVFKVFHDAQLSASVGFKYGWGTPMEVEGLTVEAVHFHRRDEWEPLKLALVPPRIFSEVMRDLDLVVSVAHRGGVDPEASASTVEMRSALVRETSELLALKNVRLKANHALIDGELGQYSVHLGSGVVHKLPGGSICIVPVHAQHRGRLFLPFADDDPRTAEVISKILLLARDREIQDPTILDQLRLT